MYDFWCLLHTDANKAPTLPTEPSRNPPRNCRNPRRSYTAATRSRASRVCVRNYRAFRRECFVRGFVFLRRRYACKAPIFPTPPRGNHRVPLLAPSWRGLAQGHSRGSRGYRVHNRRASYPLDCYPLDCYRLDCFHLGKRSPDTTGFPLVAHTPSLRRLPASK